MLFEKPKRTEEMPEEGTAVKEAIEEEGERIYVMPKELREGVKKFEHKRLIPPFVWIILAILIVAGGGFYFWWTYYYQPSISQKGLPEKAPAEVNQEPVKKLSKAQTARAEIKQTGDEVSSWAELSLDEGALEKDQIVEMTASPAPLGSSKSGYKIVAGFFNISPSDLVFSKPATLKIFYKEEQIEKRWENDLTLGYLKDENLVPIQSSIDTSNNYLSLKLDFLPASSFAIIIEESKTIPQPEEMIISPSTPSSKDTDQDGLTDVEEELYLTNKDNPDTDSDGVADGKEILKLQNPNSKEEGNIVLSGLVGVYSDPVFNYSFFYPTSWLVRVIPETENREVMITTNTNEFFTITVADNLEKLSLSEWYKKQSAVIEENLQETLINGISTLFGPDRLTLYLSDDDKIYVFSYKIGVEKEANFKTTFKTMINGWQFFEKKQSLRPDGSLIKYPDSSTVYLIENGGKRPIKSEAIYEALGYGKWGEVIEIPVDEIYPDGEMIENAPTSTPEVGPTSTPTSTP